MCHNLTSYPWQRLRNKWFRYCNLRTYSNKVCHGLPFTRCPDQGYLNRIVTNTPAYPYMTNGHIRLTSPNWFHEGVCTHPSQKYTVRVDFPFPFFWQGWDTAHYQTGHIRRWWSRLSVIKFLTEAIWTRKPNVLYLSFRRTNQRWFFLSYLIPSKKGLYFVCTGSTERQRKILFKPLYVDYKMVFSHPFGELSFTGRRTRDSKEASLSKSIANIQWKLNTYRHVVPPYL